MELWREHLIAEHKDISERLTQLNGVLLDGGRPVNASERQARLAAEHKQLSERLERLNQVLDSVNLPDQESALLIAQALVMADYLEILEKRIAAP